MTEWSRNVTLTELSMAEDEARPQTSALIQDLGYIIFRRRVGHVG